MIGIAQMIVCSSEVAVVQRIGGCVREVAELILESRCGLTLAKEARDPAQATGPDGVELEESSSRSGLGEELLPRPRSCRDSRLEATMYERRRTRAAAVTVPFAPGPPSRQRTARLPVFDPVHAAVSLQFRLPDGDMWNRRIEPQRQQSAPDPGGLHDHPAPVGDFFQFDLWLGGCLHGGIRSERTARPKSVRKVCAAAVGPLHLVESVKSTGSIQFKHGLHPEKGDPCRNGCEGMRSSAKSAEELGRKISVSCCLTVGLARRASWMPS